MTNLRVPSWLFVIALGVILIMIFMWPSPPEPYNTQAWKDSIAAANEKLARLDAQNQSLLDSIRKDSVEGAKESEAFKVKIQRLSKRLADQRPIVDSIIIDNPVLIDFVNNQDSVIEVQGWRVDALEHQLGKLQTSMVGITKNFEQRIALHEQRYQDQVQISNEYRKEARKQRREKRIAIGAGIAATVGALLIQ